MQINPSVVRQLVYAALLGAAVVLLPAIANQANDGVSGLSDPSFWNVAAGAAVSAGLRAVIAFIPVRSGGE